MILGAAILLLAAQWPGDQEIPAVTFPRLPRQAASAAAFIPKQWNLEAKADGDLNRDGQADTALVLHMDSPRNRIHPSYDQTIRYDTNPRMLVVLFRRKDGGYELAAVNHKLIPRLENPNQDEPFDEVKITAGTLRLKLHLFFSAGGWRMGGSAYTFRWQDGAFRLIGFDRDAVIRNTGETEEVSINYVTGRKLLKTGNIGGGEEHNRNIALRKKPLLTLDQIGDGLMFEPDEH